MYILHKCVIWLLFLVIQLSYLTLIIMFFMKLRLNLFDEDIAHRFGVHCLTVFRNFCCILNIAAVKTSFLIEWPERDVLWLTMLVSFHWFTKVFIEHSSDLLAYAQVWSNYKYYSTIKFLIGITPQGTILFVSIFAGVCMSDKEITEKSGIMDLLLPVWLVFIGDIVLADRGFPCNDKARMVMAEVKTPLFIKG